MINNKTVLILGAGASMPYGFPSGQGIVDSICDVTSDFKNMVSHSAEVSERDVSDFIAALRDAESESIDVFLGNNPEFEKVGKAAIAATLLPLEHEGELKSKWRSIRLGKNISGLGGHWYKYLSNLLQANTSFEEFDQNKLSIITFNYDRSLEHYLFTTLQASFRKKRPEECAEKLNAIKIIHMYGQLGYLPWQKPDPHIPFGFGPNIGYPEKVGTIRQAMLTIKTMSDDFDKNDSDTKCAKELLVQAGRVYLLGFGYHPFNLKILGIESLGNKDIRGTSLGLSFQRKVRLGELGVFNLGWDRERMNPRYLYDEDVYEFLHQHAILD